MDFRIAVSVAFWNNERAGRAGYEILIFIQFEKIEHKLKMAINLMILAKKMHNSWLARARFLER